MRLIGTRNRLRKPSNKRSPATSQRMTSCRFNLIGTASPFPRDDRSLLQGDIRSGGVLIPLFDQQPGVLSQLGLSDERKLSKQFFTEEQKAERPPVQLFPDLLLHGVSGFPHKGPVASLIPDDDFPCSILTLCDYPSKVRYSRDGLLP